MLADGQPVLAPTSVAATFSIVVESRRGECDATVTSKGHVCQARRKQQWCCPVFRKNSLTRLSAGRGAKYHFDGLQEGPDRACAACQTQPSPMPARAISGNFFGRPEKAPKSLSRVSSIGQIAHAACPASQVRRAPGKRRPPLPRVRRPRRNLRKYPCVVAVPTRAGKARSRPRLAERRQ